MNTIVQRISKGVAYLNTHYPNWAWRINLRTFEMGSSEFCVCGQVGVPENSGMDMDSELGFWVDNFYKRHTELEELTKEWLRVIAEKRRTTPYIVDGVAWTISCAPSL